MKYVSKIDLEIAEVINLEKKKLKFSIKN